MLGALAVDAGFLGNVGFRFSRVAWHAEQLQVGFSISTVIDDCHTVVVSRSKAPGDLPGTDRTCPPIFIKHANLDSGGDCAVIVRSNPFFEVRGSHARSLTFHATY